LAGNVNILATDCNGKSLAELIALFEATAAGENARLTTPSIKEFTTRVYGRLAASLQNGTWKILIPGRPILQVFCSAAHADLDFGRFKIAYLNASSQAPLSPFHEIDSIFADFAKA
jgi:hypothetical protein